MTTMPPHKKTLDLDADILTLTEAAAYFRVSTSTIYRLLKSGEVRGFKAGHWRVSHAALDAYMVQRVKASKTAVYPPRVKQ